MKQNATALERAFQLAKSGRCASILDIEKTLTAEGYSLHQLIGRSLREQLRAFISSAQILPGAPRK
jgi:hypothetical protein